MELALQGLRVDEEGILGLIDLNCQLLLAQRQGLLRMLRQGPLELRREAARVAFELGTDLRGVRFHLRDILFERRFRPGSVHVELLASELRGAFGELGGGCVARFRDLLAAAFGGFASVFLHLPLRVLDVTSAVVIEFAGEQAGHLGGLFAQARGALIEPLLERRLHLGLDFLLVPFGRFEERFKRAVRSFRGPGLQFGEPSSGSGARRLGEILLNLREDFLAARRGVLQAAIGNLPDPLLMFGEGLLGLLAVKAKSCPAFPSAPEICGASRCSSSLASFSIVSWPAASTMGCSRWAIAAMADSARRFSSPLCASSMASPRRAHSSDAAWMSAENSPRLASICAMDSRN